MFTNKITIFLLSRPLCNPKQKASIQILLSAIKLTNESDSCKKMKKKKKYLLRIDWLNVFGRLYKVCHLKHFLAQGFAFRTNVDKSNQLEPYIESTIILSIIVFAFIFIPSSSQRERKRARVTLYYIVLYELMSCIKHIIITHFFKNNSWKKSRI